MDRARLLSVATGIGGGMLLACSARRAATGDVSPAEELVFRRFNDGPDRLHLPVWALMQAGSLAAVFVAAEAVRRTDGLRPATEVAVAGTAVWGGIKLVKPLVGRGRPEHHLDDVNVRGHPQSGLGYPSGHAAVSTTLALIAATTPQARAAGLIVAAATGTARMYVGAHLPLDVVGGFAAATITAAVVHSLRR